jgi:uncharacterized RDD family membrane protein YckC
VAKAAAPAVRAPRRERALVTPEGVPLRFELGGAGDRAVAFLIDAGIILGVLLALLLLAGAAFARGGERAGEFGLSVFLLGFFALRSFWFAGWELTPRAATPGKRIMRLRVATRDGGRLTAGAVFARNATRELEIFLPLSFLGARLEAVDAWTALLGFAWSAIFLFFPLFNRDRLRAGDLLAGTWVVKAPRRRLLPDLAAEPMIARGARARFDFTPEQADAYGVKELHVLEEVLRVRHAKTVADVAGRIRTKIGWTAAPGERDLDFLEAYYAALRRRLETRLLFGHRRRDKHDRP